MGHRFIGTFRIEEDFTHDQTSAHLEQPAFADDPRIRRWLAQEVDGQAGGDSQRHYADLAQDGDIQGNISHAHEHRSGDGTARAQLIRANGVRDDGAALTHRIHPAFTLRKLLRHEGGNVSYAGWHGALLSNSTLVNLTRYPPVDRPSPRVGSRMRW